MVVGEKLMTEHLEGLESPGPSVDLGTMLLWRWGGKKKSRDRGMWVKEQD